MERNEHTHLDSQRRVEGECPACDEAWEAQRQRLAAEPMYRHGKTKAEAQVDQMLEREAGRWNRKLEQ